MKEVSYFASSTGIASSLVPLERLLCSVTPISCLSSLIVGWVGGLSLSSSDLLYRRGVSARQWLELMLNMLVYT